MALLINPYRFGGFNPASLFGGGDGGLFFDFVLDRSPMFQDEAGTTPVTAGDQNVKNVVSLAPDTNANLATNASSNLFVYKSGAIPYLKVSPANSRLTSATDFTSVLTSKAAAVLCCAFYMTDETATTVPIWLSGGTNKAYLYGSNGLYQVNVDTPAIAETDCVAPSTYRDQWVVVTGVANVGGGSVSLRINGTEVQQKSITAGNFSSDSTDQCEIHGSWLDGGNDTRIAAAFVINRLLTGGELTSLENWMKARVGI